LPDTLESTNTLGDTDSRIWLLLGSCSVGNCFVCGWYYVVRHGVTASSGHRTADAGFRRDNLCELCIIGHHGSNWATDRYGVFGEQGSIEWCEIFDHDFGMANDSMARW